MRKFLVLTGSFLLIGALGVGVWWSWPILFPSLPSGWLSTLAKADAALVQNRPNAARLLLEHPPRNLPVMGWLQWEKRVQAVAVRTGAWNWASKAAAQAQSEFPGNTNLAAYLVWTLLQDHRPADAAIVAAKVLRGTPWSGLELQAQVEAEGLASGDWSNLRQGVAEPSASSFRVYDRLAALDPDPGIRKNALLSALAAGQLDVARGHLSALTAAQRDQPPFDRLQGLMAYDQGDWARAAALLKSLSQRQPETLLVLADVYLHLGDAAQATIIYDQLLADHPNDIPLALGVNRATLAMDQGESAKALELLNRTVAQAAGNLDKPRLLILEAKFQLGDKDATRLALDGLIGSRGESNLSIDAELLKGRLFPEWSSTPRLWSLLHRHPDNSPLAERLTWLLLSAQDYAGAQRALDLHNAALKKSGEDSPWWSRELSALLLAVENRLPESSEVFATVPQAWRDATFFANWSLVSLIQAQQADPDERKTLLEGALENLTKALDLLPPASDPVLLKRRSQWLTRHGELQSALVPLQNPSQRLQLRSAATEDFRQAAQLDPENFESFLSAQTGHDGSPGQTMIRLKNAEQIARIRDSCQLLARLFQELPAQTVEGRSTLDLDRWAEDWIRRHGGKPAFKGYQGFPGTLCISINHEVIHGIPKADRKIKSGDLVSLDSGIDLDGFFSDMALTVPVGKITEEESKLLETTKSSLAHGLGAVRSGGRVRDIAVAVTEIIKPHRYGIVHQYCGHGVGFSQHEDPQVPNAVSSGPNPRLVPGMVLAVEPMINLGKAEVRVLSDQWTVVTVDGKKAAHFEHTVAILEDHVEVLTLLEGLSL